VHSPCNTVAAYKFYLASAVNQMATG